MDDLFSAIPRARNDLVVSPPFIWPDARVLTGVARYQDSPPFKNYFASADLISGVLVGVDDASIDWLTKLLKRDFPCRVCLVLALPAAGPTREAHLRALHMLQASRTTDEKKLDLRLLPLNCSYDGDCERFILPPTAIQVHDSKTGQTFMSVGSTGDAGHDPTILGSLNIVFQPDDTLRDEWRRWFQFVFESAAPLTEANSRIPHLVPAKGDPEAAAKWAEFVKNCHNNGEVIIATPAVDPTTGEVTAGADGREVQSWDEGKTALDPLAQVFQQVYAKGWLVTVDEVTRIKPLTIPVNATLLGQQSERTVGALKQKQSFSLQVLDESVNKEIEKCRKVTDLLELMAFPLSTGNRWLPETARPLIEKEIEARNSNGQKALIKALGGKEAVNVTGFIASKRESIRKDLNEMYRVLGQGSEVPGDKLSAVLEELEKRLMQALTARVTPRLVFNRISAPDLAGLAPDTKWSQPFMLLSRAAEALRKSSVDPYFPRQFAGLSFGEAEFRKVCNPFGDIMAAAPDAARAKDELRLLAKLSESSAPSKTKCVMVWNLIQGMPHFYFETHFASQENSHEWPKVFSIITAYAPTGKQWGMPQNEAADRALEDDLHERGKCLCRLIGYSPETGHAEPGWATALGWQDACDLGKKYQQDAIYHVKEDELFVSYCDDRRTLVPVGTFRDRLTSSSMRSKV